MKDFYCTNQKDELLQKGFQPIDIMGSDGTAITNYFLPEYIICGCITTGLLIGPEMHKVRPVQSVSIDWSNNGKISLLKTTEKELDGAKLDYSIMISGLIEYKLYCLRRRIKEKLKSMFSFNKEPF